MTNKPVAIILGGTNPHIELIRKLKKRGYHTVLVDYLENPPAKVEADEHIRESTLDKERVLEVARSINANLVISACVDQANLTACYVAEKLGLTRPYSYELANNITNKGFMKRIMFEKHIPTSRYIYLDRGQKIENMNLNYPVMVKPADSCAASGVKKAYSYKEMIGYLEDAQNISRNGRTVIEEFKTGIEVSVYAFICEHKAHIIMISQRMSVIEGEDQVLKCYATYAPAEITNIALVKLQEASDKIVQAFGLDNTPLHVQAIINCDEINIIEFAPRVGGGISYETLRMNTGFDILEATIDSYLNIPVHLSYKKSEYIYTVNLIYANPGTFDHVEGAQELMDENIIQCIHFHKTRGMRISGDRASGGRIAAFIVKAKDQKEILRKIKTAMERMEVYDDKGNPIMRKDLYMKSQIIS